MGQDASTLAGALERADDMEEVGVVALLGGRRAEGREAVVGVVVDVDAGAPTLVGEGRIRDHVVEGLQRAIGVLELGIGERVGLMDEGAGMIVKDHVHAGEGAGGGVLLLPVERHLGGGLVAHLE